MPQLQQQPSTVPLDELIEPWRAMVGSRAWMVVGFRGRGLTWSCWLMMAYDGQCWFLMAWLMIVNDGVACGGECWFMAYAGEY